MGTAAGVLAVDNNQAAAEGLLVGNNREGAEAPAAAALDFGAVGVAAAPAPGKPAGWQAAQAGFPRRLSPALHTLRKNWLLARAGCHNSRKNG